MRSYSLFLFSILLGIVYSAPWVVHINNPETVDSDGRSEDLDPRDRRPHSGTEQHQVSMVPGVPPAADEDGANGGLHQQRQVTYLTASPTPGDTDATMTGGVEPRQTVQASSLPDEALVPILPSTMGHKWGHPAIPHDSHHFESSVELQDPTQSQLTNKWSKPSSTNSILPPKMTTQVLSFPPKPLPPSWPTLNTTDDLRPPLPSQSAPILPGHGPFGCETTVMALKTAPCKDLLTTHTTTTTLFSSINCHGCTSVRVLEPMYMCPAVIAGGNKTTATTAYAWVSTVCKSRKAVSKLTETTMSSVGGGGGHVLQPWTPVPGLTTTTPLVWPTSTEELPRFTGQAWDTSTGKAWQAEKTG